MGPGEEARQPRSPRLTPLSLRAGPGGGGRVPSRRFAFQKLSEGAVHGRQKSLHGGSGSCFQWGCQQTP